MACIRNSGDTILNSNEIEGVDLRIKYRVPRIFGDPDAVAKAMASVANQGKAK